MTVACGAAGGGGGSVQIASVQPAGKRPMSPREWASGRGIAVGERLS